MTVTTIYHNNHYQVVTFTVLFLQCMGDCPQIVTTVLSIKLSLVPGNMIWAERIVDDKEGKSKGIVVRMLICGIVLNHACGGFAQQALGVCIHTYQSGMSLSNIWTDLEGVHRHRPYSPDQSLVKIYWCQPKIYYHSQHYVLCTLWSVHIFYIESYLTKQ